MKNRTLYSNGLLSLRSLWLVLFTVSLAQAQSVKLVNRWKNETVSASPTVQARKHGYGHRYMAH
jgi:hypothetical protein